MINPPVIARSLSFLSFVFYGTSCFFSERMVTEFERYRCGSLRRAVGGLQLAACAGLLLGSYYPPLLIASSGGLAVMMAVAVGVRFRIRDPWYAALPAFSFLGLNLYICWSA